MSLVGYKFGYKFVSNPDPGFQSWRRKFQVEASLSPIMLYVIGECKLAITGAMRGGDRVSHGAWPQEKEHEKKIVSGLLCYAAVAPAWSTSSSSSRGR